MSDEKELTQEELEKAAGGLRSKKVNKPLQNATGEANETPTTRPGTPTGGTQLSPPKFGTGQ